MTHAAAIFATASDGWGEEMRRVGWLTGQCTTGETVSVCVHGE